MTDGHPLRPIRALPLPDDVTPAAAPGAPPDIVYIAPARLRVDGRYQRDLSRRSVQLIHRIVAGWDWARFKPPVIAAAADAPDHYDVIDGQHTAIAALTHGGVALLPCLLVTAASLQAKARAFLSHNRDRVVMQAGQMHHAAAAAGDEEALTINQVCERAGVRLLRLPPTNGRFEPGDCMAVGAIGRLCAQRGAMKARIVLETIRQAGHAPVAADTIKAVDELLNGRDYQGELDAANLTTALMKTTERSPKIAEIAAAKGLPKWRAMVVVLYQTTPKRRRTGG